LGGEDRAGEIGGGDIGIARGPKADERSTGDNAGEHGSRGSQPAPSRSRRGSGDHGLYAGHVGEHLEAEVLTDPQRGVPEPSTLRAAGDVGVQRGCVPIVEPAVERVREALGHLVTPHRPLLPR
jgi:hypothetical protein